MSNTDIQILKAVRAAIRQDDLPRLRELLDEDGVLLEATTAYGTWLHIAAAEGRLNIVKYLVKMGADVDRRGGACECGPLTDAAARGYVEIVRYLLSCDAELDTAEPERNPLFAAISGGYTEIAQMLLDRGIGTHVRYTNDYMNNVDALAFAEERGRTEIAALIRAAREKL